MPYERAAQQIISYAVAHNIAPIAQVIEESREQHALQRLGWVPTDRPTAVLASRLAEFLEGRRTQPAVKITDTLDPNWEQTYQRTRPNTADPAVVRMILEGNPPRAFAAAEQDQPDEHSKIVAIARGHRSEDWLGMSSIWTRDDHRRRGLAGSMMVALGHWAARQGARYAYIQVASVNQLAIAAYTKLGFVHHHSYLYLAPGH
jgi:GNAT superfamily N-acetyltransferase